MMIALITSSSVKSKTTFSNGYFLYGMMLLLILTTSLTAAELSKEAQAILDRLMDVSVGKSGYASGQGVALIHIQRQGVDQKVQMVEFRYNNDGARSDFYSVRNNRKDQREAVCAVGPAGTIRYSQANAHASIDPNATKWLPSNPWLKGYTFNPKRFSSYSGLTTYTHIQSLLYAYPRQDFFITTDGKGKVTFDCNDCHPDSCSRQVISLDTTNGLQLLSRSMCVDKFATSERSYSKFTRLEWTNNPPFSYVSSAQFTFYEGFFATPEEAIAANATAKRSTEITILEFDPSAPVKGSDFELSGLDLPANTRVQNIVTGEEYVIDVQ